MSGNIDTTNNVQGTNGVVNGNTSNANGNADADAVQGARDSINALTNNINSNDNGSFVSESFTSRGNNRRYSYGGVRTAGAEGAAAVSEGVDSGGFVSESFTSRGNNRRYSYGGVREAGAEGAGAVSEGVDSGGFVSQSYVTKGNVRRYSYANIRRNGAEGADAVSDGVNSGGFVSNSYVGRANNRRYSYARIREDGADANGTVAGNQYYKSNTRYTEGLQKDQARTRSLTAKDNLFKKQGNNLYTYGSFVSGGQLMTRDSALDSLFYSDVANAMIDNGFILSRGQRLDIQDFNHEFSDEFAGFQFVDSDLLYQQAAVVDALISNGGFLTPEQETDLGIDGGVTNS